MFTSMSTLSPSSTSGISTDTFSTSQKKNTEEKIPWLAEGEAEKKLAITLAQIQRNEIKQLNLSPENFGRFYGQTEPPYTFSGHQDQITCLAVLPNGQLASGSYDKTIKLWELTSHSCLSTLQGHTSPVYALAVLPNGLLASGSLDKTIKLWDLPSHSCLSTLQGHTDYVRALAILPNDLLASGSSDKTIKLWDLASHSPLSVLQGHTDYVRALTILPNGLLASGSYDKTIKLWDLASHSCLSTLQGHTATVFALAVLPNGLLASGSYDQTIKLWDLASHSCLSTLQGHTNSVLALTVLPTGLLASGSADTTIKIWDLASHSCLSTLQGHTSSVYALAVLPNGLLASGSEDKTIKLWDPKIVSPSIQHIQPLLQEKAIQARSFPVTVLFDETPESKAAQKRYTEEEETKARHHQRMTQTSKMKKASDAELEVRMDKYRCPITNLIMLDPVMTTHGNPYEREAIEKWPKTHNTSPKTNLVLVNESLISNEHSKELTEDLLDDHLELWDSGEVYESLALGIKWVRAVKAHRLNELSILLSKDKRLVKIAIEDHKSLLSFALEQKSMEMARLAINRLGTGIHDIPELEAMDRMELFRKAAHQLGSEGAKLIGDALEINPSEYQSQLWWGIQHHDAALVQATLELKADPADLNEEGLRPIHVAAEMEDEKVISVLAHYDQIDNVDAKGHTALHRAILKNQPNQVRLLTAHQADVRKATPQHLTPLELSFEEMKAKQGSLPIARNLLECKADPDITDAQHQPLLVKAMEAGLLDGMRLLISYGADANKPSSQGEWLIHRAFLFVGKELASILQILVQGKANIEAKDEAGHTPLLKAVSIVPTQPEAVDILLKAKANIEVIDAASGNTPLHVAAEKGSEAIVKLLMEAGANSEVRNRANLKPLQLAKNAHRANVVEALRTKSLERRMRPFLEAQLQPLQKQIAEQKLEIERLKQALAKAHPSMSQGLNPEAIINTPSTSVSLSSSFWCPSASSSSSFTSTKTNSAISTATLSIPS